MATNTTKLGLRKPGENDFYNQQTEQADNWEKVDKFADDIQNLVDNNSGKKITGYIQDEGEKVLGNYYLDKLTTGLFRCIKSGNINYNSADYFEDYSNYANGNKLQNLGTLKTIYSDNIITIKECSLYYLVTSFKENSIEFTNNSTPTFNIPVNLPRVHEYFGPIGSTPSKGGVYGKNNISVKVSKSGLTFYNGDWSAASTGKNYSTRFSLVLVKE